MGGSDNQILMLTGDGVEAWPRMSKDDLATRLIGEIAKAPGLRRQAAE
jgi:phosphopantothenoylcysteine decarboxylase/phosphopantothenate--cysteine ligase